MFGACTSDKNDHPIFVTDVVMPAQTQEFAPGDEVTVSADGFEADDDIMLEIYWTKGSGSFAPEGYAKGVRGIISSRTATSITFLAPGHYPASTIRVLLFRGGRMMPLGSIRVADGQPETGLYGIARNDAGGTLIDRIGTTDGLTTRIKTLGVGQDISCAVSGHGSGWLHGVYSDSATGVDLTMRYWSDFGFGPYLLAGYLADASVAYLAYESDYLMIGSPTRAATPAAWPLPKGVTTEKIVKQPFVTTDDRCVLLSVDNGDGSFSPLVLTERYKAELGDPVEADALIPFYVAHTVAEGAGMRQVRLCGYAVVKNATTELQLFDPVTMAFGKTLAVVPNSALSMTVYTPDPQTLEFYILYEIPYSKERRICVYDMLNSRYRVLPCMLPDSFPYSEIVAVQ